MKKFLLMLVPMFFSIALLAQNRPGGKYINVGYSSQTLSFADDNDAFELKSKIGGTFNSGRTFYILNRPVAKMIYFGIDWTYIDLNYVQYKEEVVDEEESFVTHKAEAGMQVGPSVHIAPIDGLTFSTYYRYAPSYSMMFADSEFSGGYAGLNVAGISINYSAFGIGVEQRWGTAKHNFSLDVEDMEEEQEEKVSHKYKLSGPRVFLSFRF
ncbi:MULTISPECIES: hypothetical protein [Sphingobacterium]|uniref:Outer membrane protein beta-barrel domain-containing protein n=1 Tax=Sphingobacterium tenebrionis TaxID=3111775 RepID=A0ABU8I5J1_9SPHI|nr:hypothetical protein [Sphingobacterium sp. CZ-2]QBR11643.1 hypothetical protein E3D81_05430 [Sphingobacterium sp. CZ-2]